MILCFGVVQWTLEDLLRRRYRCHIKFIYILAEPVHGDSEGLEVCSLKLVA